MKNRTECISKYTLKHWIQKARRSNSKEYLLASIKSARRRTFEPSVKRACLEYICEKLDEYTPTKEIVSGLQERYASECFKEVTIRNWIAGLRSSNRRFANNLLGAKWLGYWYAMHPDHSSSRDVESYRVDSSLDDKWMIERTAARSATTTSSEVIIAEASMGSMKQHQDDHLVDMVDFQDELINDWCLQLPMEIPSRASLMEANSTTTSVFKREPENILGKVNLNEIISVSYTHLTLPTICSV